MISGFDTVSEMYWSVVLSGFVEGFGLSGPMGVSVGCCSGGLGGHLLYRRS